MSLVPSRCPSGCAVYLSGFAMYTCAAGGLHDTGVVLKVNFVALCWAGSQSPAHNDLRGAVCVSNDSTLERLRNFFTYKAFGLCLVAAGSHA